MNELEPRSRRNKGRFSPVTRDVLLGLPVVIALAAVVVVAVLSRTGAQARLAAAYDAEGARRLEAGDFRAAQVCYLRLLDLDGHHPGYRLGLARAEAGMGRPRRAEALLAALAPADGPGYAPAQFETARRLLERSTEEPRALADAEQHLKNGLHSLPDSPEGHELMARVYLKAGRPKDAEPFLARVSARRPGLLTLWAGTLQALGREEEARRVNESALELFSKKADDDPGDQPSRISAAEAAAALGDHERAVALLQTGLDVSGGLAYRQALARVYLSWAERRGRGAAGVEALGERLSLLERGLSHDPAHAGLLSRFAGLTRPDGSDADRRRAELRSLLVRGKAAAGVHLALAVDAQERGDLSAARSHLGHAGRLDPRMATVAGNLAWFLAHEAPPGPSRALDLINLAVGQQPDDARLRGTRGAILARLGRWHDALPDLEAALLAEPDSPTLHRALAETYDHLGRPEAAREHRRFRPPPAPARQR